MIRQLFNRLFNRSQPVEAPRPAKQSSLTLRLQKGVAYVELAHDRKQTMSGQLRVSDVCGIRRKLDVQE